MLPLFPGRPAAEGDAGEPAFTSLDHGERERGRERKREGERGREREGERGRETAGGVVQQMSNPDQKKKEEKNES